MDKDENITIATLGGTVYLSDDGYAAMEELDYLAQKQIIRASHNGGSAKLGKFEYHVYIKSLFDFSICHDGRTYHLIPNNEIILIIYR